MYIIKLENGHTVTKEDAYKCGCFDPLEDVQSKMTKAEWLEPFQVGCKHVIQDVAALIAVGMDYNIVEI